MNIAPKCNKQSRSHLMNYARTGFLRMDHSHQLIPATPHPTMDPGMSNPYLVTESHAQKKNQHLTGVEFLTTQFKAFQKKKYRSNLRLILASNLQEMNPMTTHLPKTKMIGNGIPETSHIHQKMNRFHSTVQVTLHPFLVMDYW